MFSTLEVRPFHGCSDIGGADLVLPLELSPHGAELDVSTGCRGYVVHDVDVDVSQHHYGALCIAGGLVHDVAEDGACLCGAHLDVGPAQRMRSVPLASPRHCLQPVTGYWQLPF